MNHTTSEQKSILYKEHTISFELTRKNVKNINLRIRANGSVAISAHENIPESSIYEFVLKKADYIIYHLKIFEDLNKYSPMPKEYISGESFYLLGKNLRLKVIEDANENVYSDGVYLYLKTKNKNDFSRKHKMITNYFDEQSKLHFSKILLDALPIFSKYGVILPELRIRNMETQWGSCLPKKQIITLNKKLIEVPKNCIEYVVLHEYCHFIHPNHSKHFYNFISMLMPDWKERKKTLESIEIRNY